MTQAPGLWLFRKIKKRIPAFAVLILSKIASALLSVGFALGTRRVINAAISGVRADFLTACGVQAGIILGILAMLALQRWLNGRLETDLDRDWKKHLLGVLLRADYPAAAVYHSGELINRLNNDVRIVNSGILSVIPGFAAMAAQLMGAATALLSLEPVFTVLLLIAGVVMVAVTALARKKLKQLNKRVSEAEGRVSSLLQEILEKLMLVQAMDLTEEMERRADTVLDARYAIQRKRRAVSVASNTAVSALYQLAGFGVLVWCAVGLLQGKMSFGDLTAMTQLVNQLQSPFLNLSGVFPKYAAMIASAERLMELDSLESGESGESLCAGDYSRLQALEAKDIWFSYERDTVLNGLSFRIPKGCFAVITGPSGRGKSTLLKLMLGIFHPGSGSLIADLGEEQVPLTRATRGLFAYVPQGNLLFSGTVRENLLVAAPDAGEEALRQAVHAAAMDDFLPQLPKGLDTVLGENGAGLSEGQAQRLAIARAILGGAPILLLDEATSALDADTEQRVLQRIRELPDRTCIAVTHRPAATELADIRLEMK